MTGLEEFLKTFGNLTVANVVYIIMAIIFLIFAYRKFSDYLIKKHDAEEEKNKQVKEALEAVSKYSKYHEQDIASKKRLENDMQEIKAAIEEHTKRLEKMENDSKKREINKLRNTLLQNYKYYTDKSKNPLQAWTQMESEAFWDLFGDYEDMGGDGYMHSEVQPKMQLLTVIEMHDVENIYELMNSRA